MHDSGNRSGSGPSRPVADGVSKCWTRAGKFVIVLILGLVPITFGHAGSGGQAPQANVPADKHVESAATELGAKQVQAAPQDPAAVEAARLLKLATELKAEVNKTNKDILSIRVVKTAEQIEKLSHTEQKELKASLADN